MANNNLTSTFSARPWGESLTGVLKVTNEGDLVDSWKVVFESEYAIKQQDGEYEIIGAEIISEENIAGGRYRYEVRPFNYNLILDPQESVFITFHASWDENVIPEPSNIIFHTISDSVNPEIDPEPEVAPEPEIDPEPEVDLEPEIDPEPEVDLEPEIDPITGAADLDIEIQAEFWCHCSSRFNQ